MKEKRFEKKTSMIIFSFKMNYMRKIKIILVLSFLVSCQNSDDTKRLSQMIGTAIGGAVGAKIGKGTGNTIATILGATTGYLLGSKISHILNERDKEELNEKIENTLENNLDGVSSNWKSKNVPNTSAIITPKDRFKYETYNCRNYEKIIRKDSENFKVNSKACRDENGNWKILDS